MSLIHQLSAMFNWVTGISVLGCGLGVWLCLIFREAITGAAQAVGAWIWARSPWNKDKPRKKEPRGCPLPACPMVNNGYLQETKFLNVIAEYPKRLELSQTLDQVEGRIQNAQESNFSSMMRRLDSMEIRMEKRIDDFLAALNTANTDREILKALEKNQKG
jgi:hypothetical protein